MLLTISDPEIFDAICEGKKAYEGRKWKEEYAGVRRGDLIIFFLERSPRIAAAEITDIVRFRSVREMVRELWRELVPFARSEEEALKLYKRFYSEDDPAVAFGIRVLSCEELDERTARKWLGVYPWR